MKTSPHGAPIESGRGIQSVREQIEKAFAPIRTLDRRRYAHPGEIDAKVVGRRKDDPPRPQLAQLAEPILQKIKATGMSAVQPHHRNHGACWDVGEAPVVDNVNDLFDAALAALGFRAQSPWDSGRKQRTGVK
jgi:hypothetical protein